jgi:hypothetical protein
MGRSFNPLDGRRSYPNHHPLVVRPALTARQSVAMRQRPPLAGSEEFRDLPCRKSTWWEGD